MRLRAIVNRTKISDIIRRKDIEINSETNTITKDGETVGLTPKEWQILMLLIDAHGAVVQRATIVDELRGDTGVRDESNDAKIDVYISNLRKKLDKTMIQTVKGV
jgi:DNA-binding response OmpR family regulator